MVLRLRMLAVRPPVSVELVVFPKEDSDCFTVHRNTASEN
jgi:hypothetical protein